jgi:hypothetical protein
MIDRFFYWFFNMIDRYSSWVDEMFIKFPEENKRKKKSNENK